MPSHPIGNGTLAPQIPYVLGALLEALQVQGANVERLECLDDVGWKRVLEFCDLAHLTLLLSELRDAEFPVWVKQRLAKSASDNRDRFNHVYAAYHEARTALDVVDIPHVVLKGFTQAPEFVSDPHLRMQSDIDIYCPPEDTFAAEAVLKSLGYRPVAEQDYSAADHVPTLARQGSWTWQGNMYDPSMPPSIEIHFCLWNQKTSLIKVPEVESFWDRRVTVTHWGLSWTALSTPDKAGYLALHILRGILAGDWIVHHVHELASFLQARASDSDFWNEWVNLHSIHLLRLQVIAFSLARSWFSCPLPEVAIAVLTGLPPAQKFWLEHYGGSPLEVMFRRNKDGRLLHLLLVDSPEARKRVLRRAILPNSIPGPAESAKRTLYRRPQNTTNGAPTLWKFARFVCRRTWVHLITDVEFICHGTMAWLSTHTLRGQFWLFIGASFFFDLGLSAYFFLFNLFLMNRGYSDQTLGLLTGAMAAGNIVSAIPAGMLIRRIGLRRSLMVCQLAAPLIFCMRALTLAFWVQWVLALLSGMCLCLWAVSLVPTIASLTGEKDRSTAFSLLFSLGIGMGAIGGMIGSRMPDWFGSFSITPWHLASDQATLIAAAILALVGVFFTTAVPEQKSPAVSRANPFFSSELKRLLPAVAAWGFVTGAFSPFANVYFAQHVHMKLVHIGNIFSVSQLFQVLAVLIAPTLFRHAGVCEIIFYAQLVVCACLLVLAGTGGALIAGWVYILLTGAQWISEPGIYSMLMSLAPKDERSGAAASMTLVLGCVQLVAATLAGWSYTNFGYPRSLGMLALVAILAGLLFKWAPAGPTKSDTLGHAPIPADG